MKRRFQLVSAIVIGAFVPTLALGVILQTGPDGRGPGLRPIPMATVPPAERVAVEVVVQDSESLPSFRLRFIDEDVTRTLSVGQKFFIAFLSPGQYQVDIAEMPARYEVRSITDGTVDLRSRKLTIASTTGGFLTLGRVNRITITLGVKQTQ
jgi:hypothetical protein